MEERDSGLAAFIEMLDTELPEDAKLPRLEDGSISLNKKTSGSVQLGTKVFAGFPNFGSSQQLLKNLKLIGTRPPIPPASRRSTRNTCASGATRRWCRTTSPGSAATSTSRCARPDPGSGPKQSASRR